MAPTAPPMPPMPQALPVAAPLAMTDKAARLGLVLSLLLAVSGVVGAVAKSADEASVAFSATGPSIPAIEDQVEVPVDVDPIDPADELDGGGLGGPIVVPDGFRVLQGDGVHLAVPAGWIDLRDEAGELIDEDMIDVVFPDLDPMVASLMFSMLDQGAITFAIDPSLEGNGDNINVLSVPGEMPLGSQGGELEDQLAELGMDVEVDSSDLIDTPLGQALRMTYTLDVLGMAVPSVQFYVPVDGRTYVVTATGAIEVGDQAIQTLRLGDGPSAT